MVVLCNNKDKGAQTRKACSVGCIACQKCVKVCKFEAITVANNLAYIDAEKCKLCRKCEDECPQNAILSFNFPPRKPKAEGTPAASTSTTAAKTASAGIKPVAVEAKPVAVEAKPVVAKPAASEATAPAGATTDNPKVEPAKEQEA